MASITPINAADLDFDNGTWDASAFAAQTLSSWPSLAAVIDHTLLKPEATRKQVEVLCDEAARYRFACAMINPVWAATAVSLLAGTGVPVGVVIGFPLGASLVSTLRHEAAALTRLGVRELDMVLPIGQLKSGNHQAVLHTIHATASEAHHHGALLKVILETGQIAEPERIRRAAEIAIEGGAQFLKTSTGKTEPGATPNGAAALLAAIGDAASRGLQIGFKASGGIRSIEQAQLYLRLYEDRFGADSARPENFRIGASALIHELLAQLQ